MHVVNFFDPRLGYTEFYIAKKQVEYGFKVCVVASDYPIYGNQKWIPGLRKVEGIDIFYLKSACKIRGDVWAFNPFSSAKMIKRFSPDVVHCHGLLSPLSQEALLLKNFYGYKVVGDLITGINPLTLRLISILKPFLNSWILSKVDAFFACNEAIERILLETLNLPPSKTHVIPLGADHELFKPDHIKREETRAFLGIHPEDVVAIYTGKFLPSKRIHDLLMASELVIKYYSNFKIILVGDGPDNYKTQLDSLINRLGLRKNILIVDWVHRSRLPDFYNAADFAVWPGAFSISIQEAMACGLPIIIAKSDWTAHYLEYVNGFSFKAKDIRRLSSILLGLVENSELRKSMGAGSRKLVEDKLNWDDIAKQYMKIYGKG